MESDKKASKQKLEKEYELRVKYKINSTLTQYYILSDSL